MSATKTAKLLAIANEYGNVEVQGGVPSGYRHLSGRQMAPLCRRLGVTYAPAVVGFSGSKKYGYSPQTDGVVVHRRSLPELAAGMPVSAIAKRMRSAMSVWREDWEMHHGYRAVFAATPPERNTYWPQWSFAEWNDLWAAAVAVPFAEGLARQVVAEEVSATEALLVLRDWLTDHGNPLAALAETVLLLLRIAGD